MKRFLMKVSYDGTNYCGWQKQKNGLSIQEIVEKSLFLITGEEACVFASGRTDAGVSAICQYAHFDTNTNISPNKLTLALNSKLPDDIVVKEITEVEENFHARFSVLKKTYEYRLYESDIRDVFLDKHFLKVKNLDLEKMKLASNSFIGTKDFTAFCASKSSAKDFVRTIYDIEIVKDENKVYISITGNGFLYNMVRIIVGTLVMVGLNKTTPQDIIDIIESKDRRRAGRTLPAKALFLKNVEYCG